ncbi:EAL domain-containing protein [Thalassomonas sp. M1454]|uniref:EAL domain-containing protein n=1 Tax=Thalassomonas sp. M1454 TaxID=2594477 RepID=UPI00117E67B3|nr:EAL domain-containing protein [Thalassomonas sp. M1454]TRX56351.1 EAL domain-containing protein [Thalassomonas sp. M1454]
MSTFSRILIKNIVIAIIFCICYFSFSVLSLQSFISEKQKSHHVALSKITEHYQGDDLKGFSRQLKLAFKYDELVITNLDSVGIYSYKNANPTFNFLSMFSAEPELSKLKNNNLGIYINYRLNHDELFSLYYTLTTFILIVTLLVILVGTFITSTITTGANRKASKNISDLIADEIKSAINNRDDKASNTLNLPTEFEEVNKVLSHLKIFVSNKFEKTQELEQTAYVDQLTGLENRSGFVDFFGQFTQTNKNTGFGVLIITRCSELMTINQVHGYQEGDRYICQVANILKTQVVNFDQARVFRLNGSDFATFLPNITLNIAERVGNELTNLFNEYQQLADFDSVAYSGIVKLDTQRPLGEMLALADTAISMAQTRHKNSWFIQTDTSLLQNETSSLGNQNWTKEINYVIENQSVNLLSQIIHPSSRNNKIYHEILSRFTSSEGEVLPTAPFIAMAEKLDKIVLIDRLVIEKTLTEIKEKNLTSQSFGINLSTRSIHDEHFVIWLERRLLKDHDIATRLVFEISEYGLEQNIKGSSHFIDMIHRVGARICVEHFGVGITSFKFFRELSPDYIKMDGSYTRNIQHDKNNQYFLRLMIDLAHRLGIRVIAESVESQEEKYTFDEIFMDGCQGYYLGKPENL